MTNTKTQTKPETTTQLAGIIGIKKVDNKDANWLSALIFLLGNIGIVYGTFTNKWNFIIGGFLIALLCVLDNNSW